MPASDYNPNIPQPTDTGATMQPAVLLNFGAISALIDVDHVDFAAVGAGKHKKVTFPVQPVIPVFAAGDIGLFSTQSATTGVNELYLYNVAGESTPISASILSTDPTPANDSDGWTYLPSGLLLKWGSQTVTGNQAILFPVAADIPVFTQVVSVQLSTQGAAGGDSDRMVTLKTFTPTSITAYGSNRVTLTPAATIFQYLAIGY